MTLLPISFEKGVKEVSGTSVSSLLGTVFKACVEKEPEIPGPWLTFLYIGHF